MRFAKGHGTENDFVLLPDTEAELHLPPRAVAALCDRRAGIGADGVLRVVPTAAVAEVSALAERAPWFMDYRNADGSTAEMCGNGVRVFVRYLLDAGLAELPSGADLLVATRAGIVPVRADTGGTGDLTLDLGPAGRVGVGVDIEVRAADGCWPAVGITMPNPHAVAFVDDVASAGDLRAAPVVTPAELYPDGVNVEFAADAGPRALRMRVHERGVGETRSCGTGAAAVAVAAMERDGAPAGARYAVHVPGGRLGVLRREDGLVELSGPAVIVAHGEVDDRWLAAAGAAPRGC